MASALTHGFVAAAIIGLAPLPRKPPGLWFAAIGSAILPDADVLGFGLGVEYSDALGHRGFFHSLLCAGLWGMLAAGGLPATRKVVGFWKLAVLLFAATASHGLLDALTNGGMGVAFFSPFDNSRYFFAWRPLEVSPISLSLFFSEWGGAVLRSEAVFVWLPVGLIWAASVLLRRWRGRVDKKLGQDSPDHVL